MRKIVIIGGVAGGATAAARLRRLDESAQIIMLERGENVSYANCGLPYYLGGAITDRSRLFVMTPQLFQNNLSVDVRTRHEAISIDPLSKIVHVRNLVDGSEYSETYDSLILSPGAEPIRPRIDGLNDPRVFTVRSVPDIDRIKEFVDSRRPRRAVVVGGGFIGLEMAENLHARGVTPILVEAQDQVMTGLDFEMAAVLHQHMVDQKLELFLSETVVAVAQAADRLKVVLKSGKEIPCDLVVLAIGVKPESSLAKAAGITLDERGYIVVNDKMQTSAPSVYAVGDAVCIHSPLLGTSTVVPLAGPANKQARIVADQIVLGEKAPRYQGSIATAIAKMLDMTVACTGLSEKACARAGLAYSSVTVHPSHHAGYYPEAKPFSLKVVFDPNTGRIWGAQAAGFDGVDKRIDVLAAMIGMNAHVRNLEEFEHAYAPPYSSAKDAINYAGFIAGNVMNGLTRSAYWHQVDSFIKDGSVLLDVRTAEEFALGHIEGAINISNIELRKRLHEVPRGKNLVVYCGVGIRGYLAERILRQNGFDDVANLSGGFKTYEMAMGLKSYHASAVFTEGSGMPEQLAMRSHDVITVDACGLQCPGPIMQLKSAMDKAMPGSRLLVKATDGGFVKDAKAWCNLTGNLLVGMEQNAGIYTAIIEKAAPALVPMNTPMQNSMVVNGNEATLIVFSNDLDRALASFVIANGAAATGKKVTMFFTFWGLSVIRKTENISVKKDFMGRMFDLMLPRSVHKLALSKMNFGGVGALMMKKRMQAKSVEQLEIMMQSALKSGVKMIACLMSMDIMGVAREELIDGVEIGGVATYLEAASKANVNLFI